MEQQTGESGLLNHIKNFITFFKRVKRIRSRINKRMEGKYSASLIALVAAAFSALLMSIMLFLPHYLGVADDGSITRVMHSAGIYYTQTEVSDIYNNYFIKTYSNVMSGNQTRDNLVNSQVILVKTAVYLDDLITGDKFFDIRFLALLYGILYVPGIYMVIKQACMRVKAFSEGFVIGIAGILIFTDVAYLTYFNSFYPEAIWFISLLYCVGAALAFQEKQSKYKDFGNLLVLTTAGIVLLTSRNQTAFIGILLAAFCVKLMFVRRNWMWALLCMISSFFLGILSIFCMINMESDFTTTSKFHAMTRGVLFESSNPGKTLTEFGIDSSYEMLTDVSSYDYLPLVQASNDILKEGFLNQYSQLDIAVYYTKHPGALLSMLDIAVKSCFSIRREYCGNYEKTVGLPMRAKSIFWGAWSNFKNNTAPKTIGYFIFLMGAVIFLFTKGYSVRPYEERRNTVFMDTMMMVVFICLSQAVITIINSGDAEMIKHCFLVSYGMDIITYFVFAEIVHKVNIF